MALSDIRPPTPGMQAGELHQWRQRIYEVLREFSEVLEIEDGTLVTDHNDIENNGGDDSHAAISSHMSSTTAHGAGSTIIGQTEIEALISAATTGLEHGVEVDNPSSGVHGVDGDVVGTSDTQTLTNKTIVAGSNAISGLRHGYEVDNNPAFVHGVFGEVIGTDNYQTLNNKTIIPHQATISTDHTVELYEQVFHVDTSAVTLTLKSATDELGKIFTVINESAGGIAVAPDGTDTINGETSQTVPAGSTMVIIAYGTDWRII